MATSESKAGPGDPLDIPEDFVIAGPNIRALFMDAMVRAKAGQSMELLAQSRADRLFALFTDRIMRALGEVDLMVKLALLPTQEKDAELLGAGRAWLAAIDASVGPNDPTLRSAQADALIALNAWLDARGR